MTLTGAGGPCRATGAWTPVWSRTLNENDTGWNGTTSVLIIPVGGVGLSAAGGTQIRLTLDGADTEGSILSGLWLGNGGGAEAIDFTGDEVQMQQSGGNTITIGAGAQVVTDAKAFVKDPTNPLIIAWQHQNGAADNVKAKASTGETDHAFYLRVATEASTQNKDQTQYIDAISSGLRLVSKVELFI
jgi:hypothetical protein